MSRDVYLVGGVPMVNASEVFAKVSAALGRRLKWLPDGETGERADLITWLEPVFGEHPAFAKSGEFLSHPCRRHGTRALYAQGRHPAAGRPVRTISSMSISRKPPMPCSSG